MNTIRNVKNNKGFTLIEAMIAVSVSAMISVGGIKYATEKIEEQTIDTLSSKIVSVMSGIDQRVFIDKYDQALWPSVNDYVTNNQVKDILKSMLISNQATCGVAGGWNPTRITDATQEEIDRDEAYKSKLKLIPCDLWESGKIELGLNTRLQLVKTPENISEVNLFLSFPDEESFQDNYIALKKVLKKSKELDSKNITGSHEYTFVDMTAPNPANTSFTAMECLAAKQNCGLMAQYSADGNGAQYLDVMGSNSMIDTKVKFSELNPTTLVPELKSDCFAYHNVSGSWEQLSNIDCGIGIDERKNNSFVEADVNGVSAERISLNKLCRMQVGGVTREMPCGMLKGYDTGFSSSEFGSDLVVGLVDAVYAESVFVTLLDVQNINTFDLAVSNKLTVTGDTELESLTVDDTAKFSAAVKMEGSGNEITKDLTVHGKTEINNLYVESNAEFSKDLKIEGNLIVENGFIQADYLKLGAISSTQLHTACTVIDTMKVLRSGNHSEPVICADYKDIDNNSKRAWKLASARIGQVLPFDGSCPIGFEYFEDSEGRFLMGSNEKIIKEILTKEGKSFSDSNWKTVIQSLDSSRKNYYVGRGEIELDPYGRVLVYDNGDKGGEAYHKLTEEEMPSHSHGVPDLRPTCSGTECAGSAMALLGSASSSVWSNANEIQTGPSGGGQGHNNTPPYYVVNYCIYSGK